MSTDLQWTKEDSKRLLEEIEFSDVETTALDDELGAHIVFWLNRVFEKNFSGRIWKRLIAEHRPDNY